MRTSCVVWLIALLPSMAPAQGSAIGWYSLYGDNGYATAGASAVRSMVGDVGAGPMAAGNALIVGGFLANKLTWGAVTAIGDDSRPLPLTAELMQNYPNPFNPTTEIRYQVSGVSNVQLVVYDLLGREVATLVNEVKDPGTHTVQFDGSNRASGVYFYRLQAGDFVQSRKLILIR